MATERMKTLEQAGAVVFVLEALLPLLILTWTLYRVEAVHDVRTQIGLGLALAVSLLGFVVFRNMMSELGDVIRSFAQVGAPSGAAGPAGHAAARSGRLPRPEPRATVPGVVGAIREIHDAHALLATSWKREATAYVGKPVAISVTNAAAPVVGTLLEVTDQGLVIEDDGERRGVIYRRIAGIDAHRA
ncbi:MAG: hypothetical protein HYU41_00850 [Candidatus Rokubacteria bacterium]|nr:hypothetical protein [Candidatus Rokubacteria bacterium]